MTRVSIEWTLEELPDYDHKGRKLCRIVETDHRSSEEPSTFVMPCIVTDAFIRIRRARVAKEMRDDGAIAVTDLFDPISKEQLK